MKKITILLVNILIVSSIFAQSPNKMSYQAVIRDANNNLVGNKVVGMQISILQGFANGTAVYIERQKPTTNANGLVSIELGTGVSFRGIFSNINWSNGPYYVKTEVDPSGSSNYSITTTSQMLSVPYSLYANVAGSLVGGVTESDPVYSSSAASGITNSDIESWNDKSDETDPIYSSERQYLKIGVDSWVGSLAKTIDAADTARWGLAEMDPIYSLDSSAIKTGIAINRQAIIDTAAFLRVDMQKGDSVYLADSSFIKSGISSWNKSLAKTIDAADTLLWSNKTYLSDLDGDTKIETEQTSDEDVIRMKVAGDERMSMNNITGTLLQLPTSDDNSSLKVKNSNGNVVFGVDGRGLINGDGSGLSNVKPVLGYSGGDYQEQVTSTDPYNPTLLKSVSLTVEGAGVILVQATGYVSWKSKNCDYYRMSVISSNIATGSMNFGNDYFHYLLIDTDKGCTDSTDQYSPFAYSRCFIVNSAGTYKYNLWADRVFTSSLIEMGDINMQAIYFPTGGTGSITLKSSTINSEATKNDETDFDLSVPRNIDGSIRKGGSKKLEQTDVSYSIPLKLEEKLHEQQAQIDSLKIMINKLMQKIE